MMRIIVAAAAIALCGRAAWAFSPPSALPSKSARYMFFADSAVESDAVDNVQVAPLDGSESSIEEAAKFMVDAFWRADDVSDSAKSSLVSIQADDLMNKYGERMGKRKLDALILAVVDGGEFQGLVTIEVRLLDMQKDILSADASERMLTQAVASLGPKQRREFKDASVIDIANQLLPADVSAVCSLSNLCVAPSARRKGIAAKLCKEAERVAKEELGFDDMFLRVEATNEAAKKLYEEKLGYECVYQVDAATALRVDGDSGSFVEVESDIVVLKKKI